MRLTIDRALRRICGFSLCKKLPSEATFSRAFEEFADSKLAERVQEAGILGATARQPKADGIFWDLGLHPHIRAA
jgi:hypothetical protein